MPAARLQILDKKLTHVHRNYLPQGLVVLETAGVRSSKRKGKDTKPQTRAITRKHKKLRPHTYTHTCTHTRTRMHTQRATSADFASHYPTPLLGVTYRPFISWLLPLCTDWLEGKDCPTGKGPRFVIAETLTTAHASTTHGRTNARMHVRMHNATQI